MTFAAPADLVEMLTYCRVGDSPTEYEFIRDFIEPLGAESDAYGNYWLTVGDNPRIMWSIHTDTVHHEHGRQMVVFDGRWLTLASPKLKTCLGADDGAGLWLASEMIKAKVPGVYVFHREEETGGLGSVYIARHLRKRLEGIEFAIALDRKGYDSVITHQGGRCCSDAFAKQLAGLLGGAFAPDDTGVFTDTANYTDLISECTNLSVGYFNQHGPLEKLDVPFLVELRDKLCSIDFSVLEAHRDPTVPDEDDWRGSFWSTGKWERDDDRGYYGGNSRFGKRTLARFVEDNPDFIADLLEHNGYTLTDLEDMLWEGGGDNYAYVEVDDEDDEPEVH